MGFAQKDPGRIDGKNISRAKAQRRKENPPKTWQRFAPLREKCPRQKTLFVQSHKPESLRLHRACLPTFDDLRSSFIFLDFLEVFGCVPSNKTFTERRNVPFDAALLNTVRDVFDTTRRE
jgi:hypothetical protein